MDAPERNSLSPARVTAPGCRRPKNGRSAGSAKNLTFLAFIAFILAASGCSSATPAPGFTPTSLPTQPAVPSAALGSSRTLDLRSVVTTRGKSGMVVGTMAPEAIRTGVNILRQGGTAADAALATALAQVPLLPGNFISYAGILEFLYYESQSGEIHSLNAGWKIPLAEKDPLSIPVTEYPYSGSSNPSGRTALVPGFMAGLEEAHNRFGSLPFAALFEPAIAFARQGVVLDELQEGFLVEFEPVITRLPETAALFTREDGSLYRAGEVVKQPELAEFLAQVAHNGAGYMYSGEWGVKFVETIQREGGVVTLDDMAAYQPTWTEPVSTNYSGYEIYSAGLPGVGGVNLVEAFNLIEAAGLHEYDHFSLDPESLFWLMQIGRSAYLSYLDRQSVSHLFPGQDLSLGARVTKETSAWLWERIQAGQLPLFIPMEGNQNTHSAAVVAVDSHGNIAAMTHTSNSYLYGGSGISIDGVYIPDPGSYLQTSIREAGAGNRLPGMINPVIVLRDSQPVLASSCIGNVHDETLQRLTSVLAFGMNLEAAQQAPTILAPRSESISELLVGQFFPGEFDAELIQSVRELGQPMEVIPVNFANFALNRGVLAAISLDPGTATWTGVVPAVLGGWADGY